MSILIKKFYKQLCNYFKGFHEIKLSEIFNDWNKLEIFWLILSVTILAIISITTTQDYLVLTTVATITGMINILLIAKGKILNYFFAFVNNLTYAYICYNQGIFG